MASTDKSGFDESLMGAFPPRELAVVIGAGGMSTAVARRLGQYNRVLMCDIDPAKLETQAEKLREDDIEVDAVVCDVTAPDSVAALARRVEELGGFSRLAHVAGLSPGMADWRAILAVDLRGPALVTGALLPMAKDGAAAVLISSLSAYMASPDESVIAALDNPAADDLAEQLASAVDGEMTSALAYMLAKVGVIRLARRLAVDWGRNGARINSLSPGLIASPQGLAEFKNSPGKYQLLTHCPLQRQGNMQEIADAVEFLTSERATYINGIDLLVDGGVNAAINRSEMR